MNTAGSTRTANTAGSARVAPSSVGRMDKPLAVVGTARDVTERRQAEEALRESEERFRTLYESSRDGIAAADSEGRITECNQAYADMLGYTREELQGIGIRT